MKIQFELPIPPSTNTAYFNARSGKGRHKTTSVRDYATECLIAIRGVVMGLKTHCDRNLMIRIGSLPKESPSYRVKYTFWFGKPAARDIANFEKIMTDLIVKVGIMLDDRYIDEMLLLRGGVDKDRPRVEVFIEDIA